MINCFRTNSIQKQKSNSISLSCSFLSYPRDTVHTEMLSTPMTTWHWPDPYTTACPCRCNSSSLSRNSGVATETAAFPGSPKGWKTKKQTTKKPPPSNVCLPFKISSLEYSFLKRKQKTICYPKGGRVKMEMKGHGDILLYNTANIQSPWTRISALQFSQKSKGIGSLTIITQKKQTVHLSIQTPYMFLECSAREAVP